MKHLMLQVMIDQCDNGPRQGFGSVVVWDGDESSSHRGLVSVHADLASDEHVVARFEITVYRADLLDQIKKVTA